jgi:toxin-antitoxin system, antitoxin component, hicB family|nr:MAG TPA: hydrolase [Caudoviricetes sp.]
MRKQDRYFFPAVFTYEDGQEIAVEFPDLDVATCGKDDADALLSARELLGITLLGLEEDGEAIPAPSKLSALSLASNQRAALIDVYMPAVRLAGINKAVTRTVTVPAWLNAAALGQGFNFSQVLQEALKERLGIEV